MYWRKEKLTCDILIPPLSKPIEELNLEEAKQYFDWYISCIPGRIEYLRQVSKVNLDMSPDSLVPLWDWFLRVAKIEYAPRAKMRELKREVRSLPRDIAKDILNENATQFSLQTEYIIRDIAMYFGEVYVENNEAIYWGYHTDLNKDSFANHPLLMGFLDRDFSPPFKAEFDPTFNVDLVACILYDGNATKFDLKRAYDKWQRMV